MTQARKTVPVWIVPLARVFEQLDPRVTRFEVVVVDEASQSDIMALAALHLGKQVVVVGDIDSSSIDPSAVSTTHLLPARRRTNRSRQPRRACVATPCRLPAAAPNLNCPLSTRCPSTYAVHPVPSRPR